MPTAAPVVGHNSLLNFCRPLPRHIEGKCFPNGNVWRAQLPNRLQRLLSFLRSEVSIHVTDSDDKHDAFFLAQLLILGILPQGYIYPRKDRPVCDLARKRMFWSSIKPPTFSVYNP